ncbi:MAG: hypothetical protein AAFY65_01240 [Pseudomonadota bacterium]
MTVLKGLFSLAVGGLAYAALVLVITSFWPRTGSTGLNTLRQLTMYFGGAILWWHVGMWVKSKLSPKTDGQGLADDD